MMHYQEFKRNTELPLPKERAPDIVVGVDPGQSGGVAVLEWGPKPQLLEAFRMPLIPTQHGDKIVNGVQLSHLVYQALQQEPLAYVGNALERVHAMPKQGVTSSFNFGRNFGALETILHGSGARGGLHYVEPATWKKHFGLIKTGKRASLAAAQDLVDDSELIVPVDWGVKANDGIAEAALIALYSHHTARRFEPQIPEHA